MSGSSERTTVINVRGRDRAELLADPNFVYVGRAVPRSGWPASAFGNPFKVASARKRKLRSELDHDGFSCATTDQAVARFEDYLRRGGLSDLWPHRPIADLLPGLVGKTLGCWCCDWNGEGEPAKPCHAVVLARLVNTRGPIRADD